MINITIIGMGMIGTSLGMALRSVDDKEAPLGPTTITGYDKDNRAAADARGRLAIDKPVRTLEEALRDAHLVVLAVPAMALRDLFSQIGPLLPHGATVTDVAGAKQQALDWAHELLPRTVDFVGGHPMAGKEQSGVLAADPDLFKGVVYCLTPSSQARQQALDLVMAMVKQVGAKPYYIDPAEHDHFVGGVSHLPFLLSTLLVEATSRSPSWKEMAPLAATGFRDISRLASGDVEMHRDICLTNRDAIIRWIDTMSALLAETREQIAAGDAEQLQELFAHARDVREQWLNGRPNMRPGEADFENITDVKPERRGLFGRLGVQRPRNR
jgi:prephenate dehydrogenase